MKWLLLVLFISTLLRADELYLTSYIQSFHFVKNETTHEKFNETHKAYGLEYITPSHNSFTYNHLTNSRNQDVDVYSVGHLFSFNKSFGLHLIAGYQEGYCFNGLKSVECKAGDNDTSAFALPLLYYKHEYFKLDFIGLPDLIGFRLNIKIF